MKTKKSCIGILIAASLITMVASATTGKLDDWTTTTTADCSTCGAGPSGSCSKVKVDNCACDAPCPSGALYCSCDTYAGSVSQRTYVGACKAYVGDKEQKECGANANCVQTIVVNPVGKVYIIWACVICDITGAPATLGTASGTACNSVVVYGG